MTYRALCVASVFVIDTSLSWNVPRGRCFQRPCVSSEASPPKNTVLCVSPVCVVLYSDDTCVRNTAWSSLTLQMTRRKVATAQSGDSGVSKFWTDLNCVLMVIIIKFIYESHHVTTIFIARFPTCIYYCMPPCCYTNALEIKNSNCVSSPQPTPFELGTWNLDIVLC